MHFIVEGYPAYAYTGGVEFDASRPALVFVHGAAFDHSVWQWQARYFAHHGRAVVASDLPAHGRSPGTPRTSVEALAGWLIALLDAAGLERVALAGHSMGSLVALEAALSHPERVTRLALVGASVPMAVGEAFLAAARDDSPAALDMEAVWGHARLATLAASAAPGMSLVATSRQLNARARSGLLAADLAACRDYRPAPEALARLAVPTLVVAGRRDQMTPWKAGQAVADRIPGARLVTLDAGHSMMTEAPRELTAALRDLLGPAP
ncbi:MAG TPA: alpha/beta hydrolase [Usitatibacter sp.]|nr:alpha/beta hydrolase [Usitatibacter sp.]